MRLLHGRPVAERVTARTRDRVDALAGRGITPRLDILSVGTDPAAATYQAHLRKAGRHLGVTVRPIAVPRTASEAAVTKALRASREDSGTHGVLLLTPLPAPLDEARLVEDIAPAKDVEGVHPYNQGLLAAGRPRFVPSTAEAIVEILRFYDITLDGAHAVVIGRSPVVGRPATTLLLHAHATVTLAHSRTAHLADHTRSAAIVVVAVGRERFLTGDMLARGATVIDAGINVTPAGIVGDVDAESVTSVAGALSPVPGGVGGVTTALLLRNVVTAAEEQSR
ncbi:MAG TPA: bifunctional 5,10-methylenetetrahydrofolate dehydrogenase/5,10-methenyltetrahydrofolate cyclohydrolase [Candidatus Limnocylindria bacterium]|nr:bifunctional 5,10-methylenetetrahydrofolate dehydrogenase/5,10-methenyltetrahydrofolate cyclohydrolase [Candidatus Limnocylindria bacterium]